MGRFWLAALLEAAAPGGATQATAAALPWSSFNYVPKCLKADGFSSRNPGLSEQTAGGQESRLFKSAPLRSFKQTTNKKNPTAKQKTTNKPQTKLQAKKINPFSKSFLEKYVIFMASFALQLLSLTQRFPDSQLPPLLASLIGRKKQLEPCKTKSEI